MKRDSRPVWQQLLSGLRIAAVLVGGGAAVLILASYIPTYRIEAWFWHLRHDSIDVGHYRIPVPKHWYVLNNSADGLLLGNVDNGDTISVSMQHFPQSFTLSAWSQMTSHPTLREVKATGQRTLQISDEPFVCIEQDLSTKLAHLYPISCMSQDFLQVHFGPYFKSGKKHDGEFYALLQRIQKLPEN